jgi:thiamine biosynthesis lipoprotein ApbE
MALAGRSAAAVIAPRGTVSDALATAASVLDVERALALVEATPGAAAWLAREGPAGVERVESRLWRERGGSHASARVH